MTSDILKDLDDGLMGIISANKDKWTLLADLIYLSIHQKASSTANLVGIPTKVDVDVKLKSFVSTFNVAFRVVDRDVGSLDLLAEVCVF